MKFQVSSFDKKFRVLKLDSDSVDSLADSLSRCCVHDSTSVQNREADKGQAKAEVSLKAFVCTIPYFILHYFPECFPHIIFLAAFMPRMNRNLPSSVEHSTESKSGTQTIYNVVWGLFPSPYMCTSRAALYFEK